MHGESLADLLRRKGALTAEEAIAIVLPLLDGLAAVHRAGLVHRDIKPDNVVLAVTPAGATPKLLDFGIAHTTEGAERRLTVESGLVGTPAYMSPEQVRSQPLDERSDVWGVGVLLYELIAGAPPFGALEIFNVMRRVIDDPPPYPLKARGLDGQLWRILTSALRKDPVERTPSARALHEALGAWLAARGGAEVPTAAPAGQAGRGAWMAPTLDAGAIPEGGAPAPGDGTPSIDALIRAKLRDT